MTQPKETKAAVSTYLDMVDVRRLGVAEKKLQRSRSDIVRIAVREYLDAQGIADPDSYLPKVQGGGGDASTVAVRKRGTLR